MDVDRRYIGSVAATTHQEKGKFYPGTFHRMEYSPLSLPHATLNSNTEFSGITDNIWPGTAQEVRILM